MSFTGRPTLIYVNGTSQPDGTAVLPCDMPYTEYMRLDDVSKLPWNVPVVFVTDILSTMAAYVRMSFVSVMESAPNSRLRSVNRQSTVTVSPLFIFSPHPWRTICIYTPDASNSTNSFFATFVVLPWAAN